MSAVSDHSRQHDLAGIALRASLLGFLLGGSLILACTTYIARPQLPLYIVFLAFFHIMEFWTTAQFNVKNANTASFLLSSNGLAYWAAQAAGVTEYLVICHFFPHLHNSSRATIAFVVGLLCVVFGQGIRSFAMAQAGQSFSHALAYTKKQEHVLVTGGIYSYDRMYLDSVFELIWDRFSRHPSYLGFFYFGIGTQIMLGNPISSIIFAGVLWRFFNERIR